MRDAILQQAHAPADYSEEVCQRLCERAQDEQWDIDVDLNWGELNIQSLGRPIRCAMAAVYAQIHFGEVIAVKATARALAQAVEPSARRFSELQLLDETRHVEFFTRVVAQLGENASILPALAELGSEICTSDGLDEVALGTQVILEGLAQAVFQEAGRLNRARPAERIALPGSSAASMLVQHIEGLVGRDESRHIAFGVLSLRKRWQEVGPSKRELLERRGIEWAARVVSILDGLTEPLRSLGISSANLKKRVQRMQASHFQSIGFEGFARLSG